MVTYDHVNSELEFRFDNLNQHILANVALLVGLAAERHEGVQVLVDVTLDVIVQLLILVPLDSHKQRVHISLLQVFRVQKLLHAHERLVWQTVTASCVEKKMSESMHGVVLCLLTVKDHRKFVALDRLSSLLLQIEVEGVLEHRFLLLLLVRHQVVFFLKVAVLVSALIPLPIIKRTSKLSK